MSGTIKELQQLITTFRDERDWKQFHNPKDLAIALVLEASEILEHFLWKKDTEIDQRVDSHYNDIQDEVADVAIYLIELCDILDIDLSEAVQSKMDKNTKKYPVEKSKGNAKKYSEL